MNNLLKFIQKLVNRIQFAYSCYIQKKVVLHIECNAKVSLDKTILLSYLTVPFLYNTIQQRKFHSNVWECKEIANVLLKAGFNVDVIHFQNMKFKPKQKYFAVIDIHSNLERLQKYLPKECIKILHATGSFWLFQNHQEYLRSYNLFLRRGIALEPKRIVPKSDAHNICDVATIIGNDTTVKTFGIMCSKFVKIPASELYEYEWNEKKDFNNYKKNFIWLGSMGFVHKGLDLVLEAFVNLPDFHLDICGPVKQDAAFEKTFYKELYETRNIKTWGFVNLGSNEFKEIIGQTVGIVYPSCSEGVAGSVVAAMHAGLIPVVSKETGIDITDDYGVLLRECTVSELIRQVKIIGESDCNNIKEKCYNAWLKARGTYTKAKFTEAYSVFVKENLFVS